MVSRRFLTRAGGAALAAQGMFLCSVEPARAQARIFNIPAQPVASAITALGRQADVQIAAARKVTQGKRTNAVRGNMTVEVALAVLLKGTGLTAQKTAPNTFVVIASPPAPPRSYDHPPGGDEPANAELTEDILVIGVRGSLGSAQATKRNAAEMIDKIVAEDVGKLPDRNIAEALQRTSGVQIQRNLGEGSSVAIRGLTQVRTELNGRDAFTASGANELSLEDIPSELLAGVTTYKNPPAGRIEDQLSGTIDLTTRKPFDFQGFEFSASLTDSYFDLAKKNRPSGSVLVADRWTTGIGEIGALASVAYQTTAFRQDRISVEPFFELDQSLTAGGTPSVPADYAAALALGRLGQATTLPHGAGVSEVFGERRRLGTDLSVQWRPSPTVELTGEIFRNDYQFNYADYSFFATSSAAPIMPKAGTPFSFAPNGDFQSGTFASVPIGDYTSLNARRSTTTDYSLKVGWKATSRLTVTADFQDVESTTRNVRSIVGLGGTLSTLNIVIPAAGAPAIRIGSQSGLNNPATYTSAFYLDDLNEAEASDKVARVDAEYRGGSVLTSIRVGLRYADRRNRAVDTGYRYTGLAAVPGLVSVDINDLYRSDAQLFGGFLAFPISTIRSYDATRSTLGIGGRPEYPPNSANVPGLRILAGYASVAFDARSLGIAVDGSVGVRAVRSEQTLSGFEQQISLIDNPDGSQVSGPTRFVEIDQSRSYSDVLPSLNLRMPLTRTAQIRLAASSNISRPTFAQSNPGILLVEPGRAQQDQLHEIGEGNPALRPMTSRNLDATVEWYFARTGSLSAAVFYKSISNYIQTEISTPTITFDNGHSYEFNVTTYRNAGNATIKGAEISYQEFFDFLPGALSGLGLQANFTYVDSQVPAPATTGPVSNVPAELLSKFSYNVIGIYEKGPISGRVAYNWRSRYIETTLGNQSGNLPVFNKPFGQLDASLTYHVNPRLSLTIDGVNLTDTRRSTYFGIATRPRDLTVNDRRFSAVVRLNL